MVELVEQHHPVVSHGKRLLADRCGYESLPDSIQRSLVGVHRDDTVTKIPFPSRQAPSISNAGIVPIFSTANAIQPGEWVSIYGANLASATMTWNGNFRSEE